MEGIFVYVLEYMLTLVSIDKMKNISIRNLRTEHFESYSSKTSLRGYIFQKLLLA